MKCYIILNGKKEYIHILNIYDNRTAFFSLSSKNMSASGYYSFDDIYIEVKKE